MYFFLGTKSFVWLLADAVAKHARLVCFGLNLKSIALSERSHGRSLIYDRSRCCRWPSFDIHEKNVSALLCYV